MAKAKTPSDSKPIVDVERPGKTPPDDTSKAVIVTNRPMLKDPMVVETPPEAPEKSSNPSNSPKEGSLKVRLVTKEPETADTAEPEKVDATAEPTKTSDAKAADPKPDEAKAETQPAASKTAEPAPEKTPPAPTTPDSDKETGKTDTDTSGEGQADPTKQDPANTEAEQQKAAEHDAAIQKLVESKQYFLPINSVEKRRTKRMVMLGIVLSLLLVAAWADIALDAGLVQINGVKPLTHFFSS